MKLRKTKETKKDEYDNYEKEDLTEVIDKMTENFDDELTKETKEIEEIVDDKTTELEEIKEEIKSKEVKEMPKRRRKKIRVDFSIIVLIAVLLLVAGVVLFLTIGNGGSKYGTRLKGIEKISFTKKDKNKFLEAIKSNENVNSASMDIQGKIIYVMVDVKENVSVEDARNIINGSLDSLSDAVKGYYDINALVTQKNEVPTEEVKTDTEGKETKIEHRNFPISGYKNNSSDHIVW